MIDRKTFLPILILAALLMLARQALDALRMIALYLHRISADTRQQLIEIQVISASLAGLQDCLEILEGQDDPADKTIGVDDSDWKLFQPIP